MSAASEWLQRFREGMRTSETIDTKAIDNRSLERRDFIQWQVRRLYGRLPDINRQLKAEGKPAVVDGCWMERLRAFAIELKELVIHSSLIDPSKGIINQPREIRDGVIDELFDDFRDMVGEIDVKRMEQLPVLYWGTNDLHAFKAEFPHLLPKEIGFCLTEHPKDPFAFARRVLLLADRLQDLNATMKAGEARRVALIQTSVAEDSVTRGVPFDRHRSWNSSPATARRSTAQLWLDEFRASASRLSVSAVNQMTPSLGEEGMEFVASQISQIDEQCNGVEDRSAISRRVALDNQQLDVRRSGFERKLQTLVALSSEMERPMPILQLDRDVQREIVSIFHRDYTTLLYALQLHVSELNRVPVIFTGTDELKAFRIKARGLPAALKRDLLMSSSDPVAAAIDQRPLSKTPSIEILS